MCGRRQLEVRGNTAVEFGVVPEGLARLPGALHKQITMPWDAAQHAVGFCSQITAGSSLPFRVRFMHNNMRDPQIAGLSTTQTRHSVLWAPAARAQSAAACASRRPLLPGALPPLGMARAVPSAVTLQRSSGTAQVQTLCRPWHCCWLSDWRRDKVAVLLLRPSRLVPVMRGIMAEVLARRSRAELLATSQTTINTTTY